MTFGSRLKQLRESNGYTMDKLIEIYNEQFCGKMNKSTLSRYENGLQEPMYIVVKNLANLFRVSVDYLSGNAECVESQETELFLENLKQIVESSDNYELETAGIDVNFVYDLIDGSRPLTFDIVCELTDQLGESIDDMIERNTPPKIIRDHIPLPYAPTENTIHVIRRTGTKKQYTLSDRQTDVVEGMLDEMSPLFNNQIPGTIAAVTGENNKSVKKKKPKML